MVSIRDPFDQPRLTIIHERFTWPAPRFPTNPGLLEADLAGLLKEMKKQVADLERITGLITADGIALSGNGKGATASVTILFEPDQSDDFATLVQHALTNFRLDLPGPAWLTGPACFQERRRSIDPCRSADSRRSDQSAVATERHRCIHKPSGGPRRRPGRQAGQHGHTDTGSLRYPLVAGQGGAGGGDRAIAGDVCLRFPWTLQRKEPK